MKNIYTWLRKNVDFLHIKLDPWSLIATLLEVKIDNEFQPYTRVFYLFDFRILNRIFCFTILGVGLDLDFDKQGWSISFEWLNVYIWSSDKELQKEIIQLRNIC
jgi:hypothetical protein